MIGLILLVAASAAAPSPSTTFRCVIDAPKGRRAFNLTLNEVEGSASYEWLDSGLIVKKGAAFTPNAVAFGMMKLDRRTLNLTLENYAPVVARGEAPPVSTGKCDIVQPQRAF
jgi:hypothetical protein